MKAMRPYPSFLDRAQLYTTSGVIALSERACRRPDAMIPAISRIIVIQGKRSSLAPLSRLSYCITGISKAEPEKKIIRL